MTAARVTAGAISLRSSSFSGDAIFELSKTGGVAARLGQAADQARSDRVGGVDEHHGDGLGDLHQRCCGLATSGEDNGRGESHQFGRVSARSLTYPSPTIFDADVAPDVPAGLLQALQERSVADLRNAVIGGERCHHADAPHARSACCARAASGH